MNRRRLFLSPWVEKYVDAQISEYLVPIIHVCT